MDPERPADICKDEELYVNAEALSVEELKKKDNFIAFLTSLILVFLLGTWFLIHRNAKGEKSVVSNENQALSKARRIYFEKWDDKFLNSFIYSVDQNGVNEMPLIESCPEGQLNCSLRPAGVSPDGEFVLFNCLDKTIPYNTKNRITAFMIGNNGANLEKIDGGEIEYYSFNGKLIILFDKLKKIVTIRNVENPKKNKHVIVPSDVIDILQLSLDGKYLQVYNSDGLYNFDPETGKIVGEKIDDPGIASPDGKTILYRNYQNGIFFSDSNGKRKTNSYVENTKFVMYKSLCWSQDSSSILAVIKAATSFTFEIQTMKLNPERTDILERRVVLKLPYKENAVW